VYDIFARFQPILDILDNFHRNLSSGRRADTCGQTDRRTDVTHLTGAFREYANAPME